LTSFRVLPLSLCGCLALATVAMALPAGHAQDQSTSPSTTQSDTTTQKSQKKHHSAASQSDQSSSSAGNAQADNTGQNKAHAKTADQQPNSTSDMQLTKQIRQSIVGDKSLSTYAHNVKIITQNGMVTLKGPVKSDQEKTAIASKAAEVVGGQDKVTNQLTVKQ
jgi:hyperosmotically inducible periplasmic protein